VDDCGLTPNEQFFSYFMAEQVIFDQILVISALY